MQSATRRQPVTFRGSLFFSFLNHHVRNVKLIAPGEADWKRIIIHDLRECVPEEEKEEEVEEVAVMNAAQAQHGSTIANVISALTHN